MGGMKILVFGIGGFGDKVGVFGRGGVGVEIEEQVEVGGFNNYWG